MELIDISPPYARTSSKFLPIPFVFHCSVFVNGKIFLMGGYRNLRRVLAITPHNGAMTWMSKMNLWHSDHGCASFSIGSKQFVVVTGGHKNNVTEIMDVENNIWNLGM